MTAPPAAFVPLPHPDRARHNPLEPDPDDVVALPRDVAEATYHVLQAMHALKGNGAGELFHALAKALNKRRRVPPAAPCQVCHVDVAIGLQHEPDCGSESARAYRSMIVPKVVPAD